MAQTAAVAGAVGLPPFGGWGARIARPATRAGLLAARPGLAYGYAGPARGVAAPVVVDASSPLPAPGEGLPRPPAPGVSGDAMGGTARWYAATARRLGAFGYAWAPPFVRPRAGRSRAEGSCMPPTPPAQPQLQQLQPAGAGAGG